MKKLLLLAVLFIVVIAFTFSGCQFFTRSMGGTTVVTLDPGREVVTMSWKESDLWILTRSRRTGETADTLEYFENSSMGMLEGKVIVYER